MALGAGAWSALRLALSRALRDGAAARRGCAEPCLVAQADAEYAVPARIGDYTDFYTSVHHATNIGRLFRPDNPLLPNYKWVPIGYHGRASSIGVSRRSVSAAARPDNGARRRQRRTLRPEPAPGLRARARHLRSARATRSASRSRSTTPSSTCSASACSTTGRRATSRPGSTSRSARSCRRTSPRTISPWIVTLEALAPFRVPLVRPAGDPQPLPYLDTRPRPRRRRPRHRSSRCWLADRAHARGGPGRGARSRRDQLSPRLLDVGAAGRAPHRQRLQPAAGRPVRHAARCRGRRRSGRRADRAHRTAASNRSRCRTARPAPSCEDGDTLDAARLVRTRRRARIGFGECSGTVMPAPAAPT